MIVILNESTGIDFGWVYQDVEDKGDSVGGDDSGTLHTRKPLGSRGGDASKVSTFV